MITTDTALGGDVDVAVIGSGFGGAAVACRLAQAGRTVAILEQGQEYPTGRGAFETTGRGLSTIRHGHFRVDLGIGMNVVRGVGVGGGSLHYFGVRLRAHPDIFADPRWPAAVTRARLDPYYDLAGGMLPAAPVQAHPVVGLPAHGEAFIAAAAQCRRCVGDPHYVPIAVNTAPAPIETPSGTPQTRCVFCGECLIGCPPSQSFVGHVNARALLTLNYLAVARNTGKATIFPLHRVETLRQVREGFEIDLRVLDPCDGGGDRGYDDPARGDGGDAEDDDVDRVRQSGTLRARQVVLAAGTMGSVEILLKSRAAGTLTSLSETLGRGFSGNGDFLIAKTINTPQNLQPKSGPTITAGADFSTRELKIFIEDFGLIPFLEAVMGTRKLTVTTADPYQLGYLGMGSDAANGVLRLHNGRVRLYWDPTESLPLYRALTACFRELSQQLVGDYAKPEIYNPITGTGLITAHPLGGALMSDTAATGVVSPQGEVHGVPGLFVADGAIVPTALATNPSYTISALAERVAFWMIHGREMRADDPEAPPNA